MLFRAIYSEPDMRVQDVDAEEQLLTDDQSNVYLRARLLAYYCLQLDSGIEIDDSKRLQHLFWFVEHMPYWRFCGESFFYLEQEHVEFENLLALWTSKIHDLPDVLVKVNAYMLLEFNNHPDCSNWFNNLFEGLEQHIWVRALSDLLSTKTASFLVETPVHADVLEAFFRELPNLSNVTPWERTVVKDSEMTTHSEFESAMATFAAAPDVRSLLTIVGYTWSRYRRQSLLEFDPELLAARFLIATFIVQCNPESKLASSPFFMEPFTCPALVNVNSRAGVNRIHEPSRLLCERWLEQLALQPESQRIAENAAYFAFGNELFASECSMKIKSALKSTKAGKAALRKVNCK